MSNLRRNVRLIVHAEPPDPLLGTKEAETDAFIPTLKRNQQIINIDNGLFQQKTDHLPFADTGIDSATELPAGRDQSHGAKSGCLAPKLCCEAVLSRIDPKLHLRLSPAASCS